MRRFSSIIGFTAACCLVASAAAGPVDFNLGSEETYPPTTFAPPIWLPSVDGTMLTEDSNGTPGVWLGVQSILNTVVTGQIDAGGDDDEIGLVLGFEPGDATSEGASYLFIDWKGVTQNFDWADDAGVAGTFNDLTPATDSFVGLAISQVTGLPTADELWGNLNLPENPLGSVDQLARGATLGSTPYNRAGGVHDFTIVYTADRVQVDVDGVQQFDIEGTFSDGNLGMYHCCQAPGGFWANFNIEPLPDLSGDFDENGTIDILDFDILRMNFLEGTSYAQGDINFSGLVDVHDFLEFKQAFLAANPGAAAASSVPEPSTLVLMALALVGVGCCTRRRRAAR